MFTIDLRTIYRGLNSLFSLSRFLFLLLSRSFLEHSFGIDSTFVPIDLRPDHAFHIVDSFVPSLKVPVHIFHLENIVNHVFEDLQKTKAPNNIYIKIVHIGIFKMEGVHIKMTKEVKLTEETKLFEEKKAVDPFIAGFFESM
jgi:hypothetical protein